MTKSMINTILYSVLNCNYCKPLSGCLLSDLKGKSKNELKAHLLTLNKNTLNKIVAFHDCCPYKDRLAT